jgi:hypothetical protein
VGDARMLDVPHLNLHQPISLQGKTLVEVIGPIVTIGQVSKQTIIQPNLFLFQLLRPTHLL